MVNIKDLAFSYGKTKLFSDLSLSIEPGTIYGLLGKNGAGKTTLLKLLSGFVFPKGGEITVLGDAPAKRKVKMLQEIYLVPEEFHIPFLTLREYIKINSPFYPRFSLEQFEEYRKGFDLEEGKKLSEYSYGQKKKFLIAFGLATNCSLLFLDEPTNGLDIPSKSQFRRLVAGAVTEERSFIISTHQVRDMENLIDPLIFLEQGRIIFQHSLEEIMGKLSFQIFRQEPQPGEAIYSEKTLGGYLALVPNQGGEDSQVDIEVLFNALMTREREITALFLKENTNE